MLQTTFLRNILINLSALLPIVCLCSCDSDKVHISTTEEIKSQADSIRLKSIVFSYKEGKQLFSRYCNTCHLAPEINKTDQYLFDNLFERLPAPAEDYFFSYISDSKALKESGNVYTKQVDDVWNNAFEHQFKDSLSKYDFYHLITYIKIAVDSCAC